MSIARVAAGHAGGVTARKGSSAREPQSARPGIPRLQPREDVKTSSPWAFPGPDRRLHPRQVRRALGRTGPTWTASRFGAPQSTLDGLALTSQFTYPQFVSTPEGRLQLSYRAGVSGNGRNALAEYDGTRWTALGEWTASTGTYRSEHGSSTARNVYLHGIDHDRNGRLHAFFTWREQNGAVMCSPGGITNHDTGYVHSDDRGRTWRNDAGPAVATTGTADRGAAGPVM
ncbi:hypothetical protein GCM10027073_15050 [Streptomyces chlorus]